MGADIRGLGTTYAPDSIAALRKLQCHRIYTYAGSLWWRVPVMAATAITGGDVTIRDVEPDHLRIVIAKLEQMAVGIDS